MVVVLSALVVTQECFARECNGRGGVSSIMVVIVIVVVVARAVAVVLYLHLAAMIVMILIHTTLQ